MSPSIQPRVIADDDGRVDTGPVALSRRFPYGLAILTSLVLGSLSLLVFPTSIAYDPWSWLIWGRELAHLSFTTKGAASSFKPLPMLVTTAFAFTGRADPYIWMAFSRAGAVMAVLVAFALGARARGPMAGLIAACGLISLLQFFDYLILDGMSEPLLAALCLAAAQAYLDRRRWLTVLFLFGASLLRIELAAFMAVYGYFWLVRPAPRPVRTAAKLVALLVSLLPAWFLADLITTGNAFRSASRATVPTLGGALLTRFPGLATLQEGTRILLPALAIGCGVELLLGLIALARRRRTRSMFGLSVAAAVLLVGEATMAQLRLATGASRFLIPGGAVAAVVGACIWVDVAHAVARRCPGRVAKVAAAVAVYAVLVAVSLPKGSYFVRQAQLGLVRSRDLTTLNRLIPEAINQAGGRQHMLSCGRVYTTPLEVPAVSWVLDLPLGQVGIDPRSPGTVLSTSRHHPRIPIADSRAYHLVDKTSLTGPRWRELTTCVSRHRGPVAKTSP